MLCYCRPNDKVYKRTLIKSLKNSSKLGTKSQLLTTI